MTDHTLDTNQTKLTADITEIVPGQEVTPWQPPSVDEVILKWKREPGRRGKKSKEELAAEAANTTRREAYQRTVDELALARRDAQIYRTAAENTNEQLVRARRDVEDAYREIGELRESSWESYEERERDRVAAEIFALVTGQLSRQTGMEIRQTHINPTTSDQAGRMTCMLGNNNDYSVVLTSRPNGMVEVAIEEGRVMTFVVGANGLTDEQQSAVHSYFARKQYNKLKSSVATPRKDWLAAIIGLLDLSQNCGNPNCPFCGKNGLKETGLIRLKNDLRPTTPRPESFREDRPMGRNPWL